MTSWQKARWQFRAYLCEVLIGWSNLVCPEGYVPSTIEATVKMVMAERQRTKS